MKHEGKIKKEEIQSFISSHALPADKKQDDPLLTQKLPSLVQALTAESFNEKVRGVNEFLMTIDENLPRF